ncbi:MAG: sulfotransferase [Deltaproteobacteria bacterium]|nr:sulfotransferase [Deltaproteobacteria bacterium]
MSEGANLAQAVIVLGMHRTGTSVLTRALAALGVHLGTHLMGGKEDNPKGFFEDQDVNDLTEEILEAMHCGWDSLLVPQMSQELLEHFLTRAVNLIRQHFGDFSWWGLKDPRITRLLPFWQKVLSEAGVHPVYILANRHPLSVAASLEKRNDMPRGHALGLWVLYQAAGLETLLLNGGLVVDFDFMVQEPETQLRRLSAFLGLNFEPSNSEILVFLNEFLDHSLRHWRYTHDQSDIEIGELGTICRALYLHLRD